MNTFSNQINIGGRKSDILKFLNDESCVPYHKPDFCHFEGIIYTEFTTHDQPCRDWFNLVRTKHPKLEFKLFYRDICNGLSCGFIDQEGNEFQLPSSQDFKLACSLLKEYKR